LFWASTGSAKQQASMIKCRIRIAIPPKNVENDKEILADSAPEPALR
jgi:hypothetical protein